MDNKYLIVRMFEEYQPNRSYSRSIEIVKIVDSRDEAVKTTQELNDNEPSIYVYHRYAPLLEGTDLFSNLDLEGWFTFDEDSSPYHTTNEGDK